MRILPAFLSIGFIALHACNGGAGTISKPDSFEFGRTLEETRTGVLKDCDSMLIRMDEPIFLPTVQYSQSQLDLSGFYYAGQKRNVELVFADDSLDLIWILINPGEDSLFVKEFTELYGAPTHIREDATFFLNDGVAVRNSPHEVLFLSERLREPYRQWLDSAD